MDKLESKVLIIIPCYNEANRMPINEFIKFNDSNKNDREKYSFLFVNDGSTDDTLNVLISLCRTNEFFSFLDLKQNCGKAEAVRQGMLYASRLDYDYIGFLDADLAAPIDEIQTLYSYTNNQIQPIYIFGARVQLLGSTNIKRSLKRHYLGRVFSTVVSIMLDLKVYDTQCGAKLVKRDLIPIIFNKPFITKWLFDVEILFRIKSKVKEYENKIIEAPLNKWEEKSGSKISPLYFFKAPIELLKVNFHYKSKKFKMED